MASSRHVSFGAAIEYFFAVGFNGSALPHDAMPGVGLSGRPIARRQTDLSATSVDVAHAVLRYSAKDRLFFLKRAGFTKDDVTQLSLRQRQLRMDLLHSIADAQKEAQL
ncbi:hypothetical protein SPRG_15494 [Saprolegnia parasitica CBS 223.65]|uniref:Uncharacterized protein n=1 Tax=Saprolegnia parasitica (strain CBS 223.65) TaxID=695850 RepID=A0A067BLP5_SAPPC|nr:hypothetical protein SPRG_15494 [Saprolegnia parasitica CBS 223.65]KDO19414.1 hypothetical protein SPRG_15494 [Saprolegnia parasitica CBS 223.65]|eukprot:XP_012209881.1 hypothetical protein SPRG_15494 [Saprolegnia parasitica CBS 223.65]